MARINWKNVEKELPSTIKTFTDRDIVPTVRTVYYALVSKEIIPNTRSAYQGLCKKLRDARKSRIVSWEDIADETRTTSGSDNPKWESPEKYSKAYVDYLFEKLQDFKLPMWLNQDYYIEIWIEKSALRKTFSNWTDDLNIVLVPSRGYSSWTFLYEAYKRLWEADEEKEKIILYFGDFDPSGKDIERFIAESLNWFGVDVEVKNIAITKEHIDEYNLPSTPDDAKEIAKLMRDPRYKNWEHGLFRVELDALMAYVPDEFERIVKESVAEYFDQDVYDDVLEQEEKDKKTAWETAKELLDEKLEELRADEEEMK